MNNKSYQFYKLTVFSLMIFLAMIISVDIATSITYIEQCGIYSEDGETYYINAPELIPLEHTFCFILDGASNIVIDGQFQTFDGNDPSGYIMFDIRSGNNITIQNVNIVNSMRGVMFRGYNEYTANVSNVKLINLSIINTYSPIEFFNMHVNGVILDNIYAEGHYNPNYMIGFTENNKGSLKNVLFKDIEIKNNMNSLSIALRSNIMGDENTALSNITIDGYTETGYRGTRNSVIIIDGDILPGGIPQHLDKLTLRNINVEDSQKSGIFLRNINNLEIDNMNSIVYDGDSNSVTLNAGNILNLNIQNSILDNGRMIVSNIRYFEAVNLSNAYSINSPERYALYNPRSMFFFWGNMSEDSVDNKGWFPKREIELINIRTTSFNTTAYYGGEFSGFTNEFIGDDSLDYYIKSSKEPLCEENWNKYLEPSTCIDGTQQIRYYDSNNCGTYNNLPSDAGEIISCCIENWKAQLIPLICNSGQQQIIYTDQNYCGTSDYLPADNGTYKTCCVESWTQYLEPSKCLNGTQQILYSDRNKCGTSYTIPDNNGTIVDCYYCIENWEKQITPKQCKDGTQLITYTDKNKCGTTQYLPGDNGTIITCCTESWVKYYDPERCTTGTRTLLYYDKNSCGTIYNLPLNNGTIETCRIVKK
jgi:hypothetical protein